MKITALFLQLFIFTASCVSFAQNLCPDCDEGTLRKTSPSECGEMESWDFTMGMCMPLAMAGMPMRMAMLNYNSFFLETIEEGRRGRHAFSIPDMFMADIGSSVGDKHYLNLDFMGTFERWTYPESGTPELLQIGEQNANHEPYLDAQHPHSSPIMGLTLSDTYSLGAKNFFKLSFAPRGQSTDGPVAFMHRPTGMMNPDAPLGHHVGQDVGHVTSTVLSFTLHESATTLQASTFNGTEPEPSKSDLPLGAMNSYALRLTQEFNPRIYAMASAAYVKHPEPTEPELDHVSRYSISVYNFHALSPGWTFHNSLIWGLINFYDETAALNSFTEEFWFHRKKGNIWGRVEYLQRTPHELEIDAPDAHAAKWVTALTLGNSYELARLGTNQLSGGVSLTKDILPTAFWSAYGGDPLTAKIFVQVGGSNMWDL